MEKVDLGLLGQGYRGQFLLRLGQSCTATGKRGIGLCEIDSDLDIFSIFLGTCGGPRLGSAAAEIVGVVRHDRQPNMPA
jgi:hypothetical protein